MTRLVLVLVLCACGGKSGTDEPAGEPLRARVPKVDSAAVTIVPPASAQAPLLVFVEEDGKLSIGAGPDAWTALATYQPSAKDVRVVDAKQIWPMLREDLAVIRMQGAN